MSDDTHDSGAASGPQRDKLSGHEYDGIQEYDNPTPGWWVWVFVGSVVFAGLYFVYYHSAPDRSIYDRLNDAADANAKKKLAALGITQLTVTESNMLLWMSDVDPKYQAYRDYGRSVFKQNCVACHGANGEGLVGPNLTDDYYKNIKKLTDIPRVINNGANNGAMPAWERLGPVDVALVATYVATLRGKNLPSGISPATYGDKIDPWPPIPVKTATASAPDSK